ncbi:MAG TPA: peptide deformylase, partial [Ruminococcus sp.]|nr:peptide deformylase [Ruminococcus sp.]
MIREIVKDTFFLSQKSEPATRQDQPVIQDLLDTVRANADRCVGMAA